MKFTDSGKLSGVIRTSDGYITASVKAARTGIQHYAGWEIGKPELETVAVYRPRDSVFARDSLESFPNIPLTLGHPDRPVTAKTYDVENVGNVFEVVPDGESIRASIQIMSQRAIDAVQSGARELSVGYDAELVWDDGVTPDGQAFQATQKNIRANHLAIVDQARAGPEYRIGDDASKWGAAPLSTADKKGSPTMADNLQTVVVDGLTVQTTDQGAQAIAKLLKDAEAQAKALTDAQTAHKAAIDEKDKELATKDAKIEAFEKSKLSDAALDARVEARASLLDTARRVAKDLKIDGLSDADIRKAVVSAKLGDAAIKDRSDAYIEARFDVLAEDATKGDMVADAITKGAPVTTNDGWGAVVPMRKEA